MEATCRNEQKHEALIFRKIKQWIKDINWKQKFLSLIPYAVLLIATILSQYILLNKGLASGDDITFHLSQIEDVYLGYKRGFTSLSVNHEFYGGFGLFNYGFYGPFSHYSAAIVKLIFNTSTIAAVKIMLFLSCFIGGCFTYKFVKKISSNVIFSLIISVLFLYLPYRSFCALCRFAYAEAVAISFIPIIFYGLYRILHDSSFKVSPYICLISGSIGIILTHAYTGLITATFCLIYLIFNIKLLIKKRKGYNLFLLLGISLVMIGLGVGFYLSNVFITKFSNIYRFCDEVIAWTNKSFVMESTYTAYQYSGFLNLIWLNQVIGSSIWINESLTFILMGILVGLISIIFYMAIDQLIKKLKYSKWYRIPVAILASLILPLITMQRIEVYLAILTSLILYFLFIYRNHLSLNEVKETSFEKPKIYKNPDIYFCGLSIILLLVLITNPNIWLYMPSIFRQCQFAWRNYSLLYFILAFFTASIFSYFRLNKFVNAGLIISCSVLLPLNQSLIEKRAFFAKESYNVVTEFEENEVKRQIYSGAINEMVPQTFYDDSYISEYSNSLYGTVKKSVRNYYHFIHSINDYITPAFLIGEGAISIYEYNTPNVSFTVTINEKDSLIQIPQFYVDGYYANFSNSEINKKVKAENVDGLCAFRFDNDGVFDMKVIFEGNTAYKITRPFFYISLCSLLPLGILGYLYSKKLKKREVKENAVS